MSARGLDTEYTEISASAWPLRPWAEASPATETADGWAFVPEAGTTAAPRKARDRGASAVEWGVITAIVVAIVTGVGVLIANAVKDKATNACNQIASTDTNNTIAGATGGNSADCAKK